MHLIVSGLPTSASRKIELSSEEKQFEKAWQQVIEQQKHNERLRRDAGVFAAEVKTQLKEHEVACLLAMNQACRHLMSFFSRKSLGLWQRETLLEWVKEYLSYMQGSLFAEGLDLAETLQIYSEVLDAMNPVPEHTGEDGDEELDDDDLLDDFFEGFRQATEGKHDDIFDDDASAEDNFFDQFFRQEQQREREAQQRADELALKQMMKASSINKLFRKLARLLHPDRETDESAREEKNRLMAELIQARNTNDIPALFSLYAKHVGEAPLQELGGDLASVTELLQRQYEQLCRQRNEILQENPQVGMIYERFHCKTRRQTQQLIKERITELQEKSRNLQRFCVETRSISKLKPYLQSRRKGEGLI